MQTIANSTKTLGATPGKHELMITQGDLQSLGSIAGWLRRSGVSIEMIGGIYPTVSGEENVRAALRALGAVPMWRQQFADHFERYGICSAEEVDRARRGVIAIGGGEIPIQPNAIVKK